MHRKNLNGSVNKLVLTAIMMALVIVSTMIVRIPVPATQGYIHLGDCMVFCSVYILGVKYGAVAAGVGSAMADLFAGYAIYIPITLIVKGLMALILGLIFNRIFKLKISKAKRNVLEVIALAISGFVMVGGYYIAESFMYGSFISPLASIPMNILQFVVGIVLVKCLVCVILRVNKNKETILVYK